MLFIIFQDLKVFLDTLHKANEMAVQLKQRSETLLNELQIEMDQHLSESLPR